MKIKKHGVETKITLNKNNELCFEGSTDEIDDFYLLKMNLQDALNILQELAHLEPEYALNYKTAAVCVRDALCAVDEVDE